MMNRDRVHSMGDGVAMYRRLAAALLGGEFGDAPDPAAVDWPAFIGAMGGAAAAPLLYRGLQSAPAGWPVPAEVRESLKKSYVLAVARAAQRDNQLTGLLDALTAQGTAVLVLKGAAVAHTVYPEPALRAGVDLDLLVQPAQMPGARRALQAQGYTCPAPLFTPGGQRYFCQEHYLPPAGRGGWRGVELHWHLFGFPQSSDCIPREDLFGRAVTAPHDGGEFRTLHPADALIYAARHFVEKHGDEFRLDWVMDIALLAGELRSEAVWDALRRQSVVWAGAVAVRQALELARDWTGWTPPFDAAEPESWPAPEDAEAAALADVGRWHRQIRRWYRAHYAGAGVGERLRFGLFLLWPPAGHIRGKYPRLGGWKLPLAYLRHMGEGVGRYLRRG